jgi:predicted phosphate transport protein (TIGR00153 family)
MRFRLVPTDTKFYELFTNSAQNAVECSYRLRDLVKDFTDVPEKHKRVVECEHRGDRMTAEILTRVNHTFVTPFDREDVHALAEELDDVVDDMLGVSDLMQLVSIEQVLPELVEQADILVEMTEQAAELVGRLESMKGVQPYLDAIDRLESQGDTVYRRTLARLFKEFEAVEILRWKDIVTEMERALNTVEDVSNVVESIVVKYA